MKIKSDSMGFTSIINIILDECRISLNNLVILNNRNILKAANPVIELAIIFTKMLWSMIKFEKKTDHSVIYEYFNFLYYMIII